MVADRAGASSAADHRARVARFAESGDTDAAVAAAFAWLDHAIDDVSARAAVARLVRAAPGAVPHDRIETLRRLINDPAVDPDYFTTAGWMLLDRLGRIPCAAEPAAVIAWLERDRFARELLSAGPVTTLVGERPLTAARRWLLLNQAWLAHPDATAALRDQARHNGGAWPFDEVEAARLSAGVPPEIRLAYLPERPAVAEPVDSDAPTTRTVAAQYARWPFPVWSRSMMMGPPATLARLMANIDPDGATRRAPTDLLIAGCGTGWEAAAWAQRYPDADVMAIDISPTSLAYAEARCRALGLRNLRFQRLDLHDVAMLGQRFDVIVCSGVLHHLENCEAGWAALADALAPGGLMRIMLYSRVARLEIAAMRHRLRDLREGPVDDGVLRAARLRMIRLYPAWMTNTDLFTLGGLHDLLFNVQEDCFDVPRIERAVAALGLDFLGFGLPDAFQEARYRAAHPHDPHRRDFAAWRRLEIDDPLIFKGMYRFWCRKP